MSVVDKLTHNMWYTMNINSDVIYARYIYWCRIIDQLFADSYYCSKTYIYVFSININGTYWNIYVALGILWTWWRACRYQNVSWLPPDRTQEFDGNTRELLKISCLNIFWSNETYVCIHPHYTNVRLTVYISVYRIRSTHSHAPFDI